MGISLLQWQFDQAICGELMKILDPRGEELKHLKRVRLGTEKQSVFMSITIKNRL